MLDQFTLVNMGRRSGASARTKALVKAAEAVARRDAERIAREKRLQATLADFYHAQDEVERIHRAAKATAAPFDASIRSSVRALDALGETRAGIAGLTGLSPLRVREYLTEPDTPASVPGTSDGTALVDRTRHTDSAAARTTAPVKTTGTEP